MIARTMGCGVLLALAGDALASDGSACHKARRHADIDTWTSYVLAHPDGKCVDEAMGQLLLLAAGRMMSGMVGDPTKFALAVAQIAHTDPSELAAMTSMLGGGGLGGLSGLSGMGGGTAAGLSSLFGTEGSGYGDYSSLFGSLEGGVEGGVVGGLGGADSSTIYVSYAVDHVDGSWNDSQFWNVLDATRPELQSCYSALGKSPMSISYLASFAVEAGHVTVSSLEQQYAEDSAPHADIDGCLKKSLEKAAFPADLTGKYSYRIDLY
jgi:hypothetical protein